MQIKLQHIFAPQANEWMDAFIANDSLYYNSWFDGWNEKENEKEMMKNVQRTAWNFETQVLNISI